MSNNFFGDIEECILDPNRIECDMLADYNETREQYIARVEAEGLSIQYPLPNELQIDLDEPWQQHIHDQLLAVFNRYYPDCRVIRSRSKSGTGVHVRIFFPREVTDVERIAWQAALGSDPIRELLSLVRMDRGDIHPTLFVEKPE